MPQSVPPGLTREHVLHALADLDAGVDHPFGPATGYELVHDQKRYAPKAVVGLACRYSVGRVLQPGEFSGGDAAGVQVVLVTVEGGGHTWPGRPGSAALGRSTRNVSANDLIWEFFERHSMG